MLSKKLTITLIGTSILLCTSLIAAPALKHVKAMLNPTIQYTLDGNTILKGTQTLNYNNKNYVSVAELANALGLEVSYKDNVVSFVTPTTPVTPETPASESITIAKATIKEISLETKQVTILPEGKTDEVNNYIVLNIGDDTHIKHYLNKAIYKINDLKTGMTISATHSPAMTRSIPPQTAAFTITILEEESTTEITSEAITLDKMVVAEVNQKENYFIVTPQGADAKDINVQTIIRYDQKTKLSFDDSSKQSNINSLKVGSLVTLRVSPAMTLSIPPQTFVLEIQVH